MDEDPLLHEARVTFFDKTAGFGFGGDRPDNLGRLAEINKSQMQNAMAKINRFGRTDYNGAAFHKALEGEFKKHKRNADPLHLKAQNSVPNRNAANITPVITEQSPDTRPRTNQSSGDILPKAAYYQGSTTVLQSVTKLHFACASCQTPLFSSKDFLPHTAQ